MSAEAAPRAQAALGRSWAERKGPNYRPSTSARNAAIVAERRAGALLADIAAKYDLTAERVRQIVAAAR